MNQQEATLGDSPPEGQQPDPAWLAACRQAMHVHVSSLHSFQLAIYQFSQRTLCLQQ